MRGRIDCVFGDLIIEFKKDLRTGIKEAKDLIPKAQELLKNVKSVKPMLIPAATKGIKGSLGNLNNVVKNTPKMLEEMKVLLDGFKALS